MRRCRGCDERKPPSQFVSDDGRYKRRCRKCRAKPRKARLTPVTAKEHETFRLICAGFSTREVAAQIGRHHRTVEEKIRSVVRKLGARNRIHAVARYSALGLLREG